MFQWRASNGYLQEINFDLFDYSIVGLPAQMTTRNKMWTHAPQIKHLHEGYSEIAGKKTSKS